MEADISDPVVVPNQGDDALAGSDLPELNFLVATSTGEEVPYVGWVELGAHFNLLLLRTSIVIFLLLGRLLLRLQVFFD